MPEVEKAMLLSKVFCSMPQVPKWIEFFFSLLLTLCPSQANSISSLGIIRNFSYPSLGFRAIWNVPSYKCKQYGLGFEHLLKSFEIDVNKDDNFRGNVIIILYDPGMFPVVLKNPKTNETTLLNGGGPHNGSLTDHIDAFTEVIEKVVPQDFDGVGVLDFESWRPVFRQNWNEQVIYKEKVIDYVKMKNPNLSDKDVMKEAKDLFERTARKFMEETLITVKKLRPQGMWGYYGYPYCLNYGSNGNFECPVMVQQENIETQWLFKISDAFYPSLYLSHKRNKDENVKFIIGRLNEAWKVTERASQTLLKPVLPYVWYNYNDLTKKLSDEDMYNTMVITAVYKLGGFIIWGSSSQLRTEKECKDLYDYVTNTLGPQYQEVKANARNGIFTLR